MCTTQVAVTIGAGATLKGKSGSIKQCDNEADWQGWCAFLTIASARNFSLQGAGTLDGGGKQVSTRILGNAMRYAVRK